MRAFPALIFAAALVGACLPSASPTPAATSPAASANDSPTGTEAPPSAAPTAPPTTDEASPSILVIETPPAVEPSASASGGPGPAGACSGSAENRDFYRAAASALSWTVYCAVLPAGWFVDSGQYRHAGGGCVRIAYTGPGGPRLEVHAG